MYNEIENFIKQVNPLLDDIPITIGMEDMPFHIPGVDGDNNFVVQIIEGANMLVVNQKYNGDMSGLLEQLVLLWGMTNGMVERKEFELLAEKEREIKRFLNRDPLGIRDEED